MSREGDCYCGVKILWSWDWRFWSWFTSHGVYSAHFGGKWETNGDGSIKYTEAPRRVFDRIYHLGPLKMKIGVMK